MGDAVLIGAVMILLAGCCAARLVSRTERRRREARALREFVRRDIKAGRRRIDDSVVADVLSWCDQVAVTGRDLPLAASIPAQRRPSSASTKRAGAASSVAK
jgi:hypothetical protein